MSAAGALEPRPQLRKAALHAVLAGLCPLVPVPFLDDKMLEAVREAMVRQLLEEHGLPVPPEAVPILAGTADGGGGGAFGIVKGVFLWPVKKLFKKIFLVLSLKDCADQASDVLHEGWLLQHAAAHGALAPVLAGGEGGEAAAVRLRAAMRAATKAVDTRPLSQVVARGLGGSQVLLAAAAASAAPIWRRLLPKDAAAAQANDEVAVRPLADRLAAAVAGEGTLERLTAKLDEELARKP